jgi:hypothetical protein
MKTIKDWTCLILSGGLMFLLITIVVGDFYVALHENRPVDESIINLLQMAVTGIIGIVAGYLSGKDKSNETN